MMSVKNRVEPSPKLLPFEQPPFYAFKIYIWRAISVAIVFWLITVFFWGLQISTVGVAAFSTELFTLVWGTGGTILVVMLIAILTQPDIGMIAALGFSGWIQYNFGFIGVRVFLVLAIVPIYVAQLLPIAPFNIKLIKLSVRLQYHWIKYIQSWIELAAKLDAAYYSRRKKLSEADKKEVEVLQDLRTMLRDLIVKNRKYMQRLERAEKQDSLTQRQNIKELIDVLFESFSAFPPRFFHR